MEYRYGNFNSEQIKATKEKMRKQIFFLLLVVDPKTSHEYSYVDVDAAFDNILTTFGGLNDLLNYPAELVEIMSLLDAAYSEYKANDFEWERYRKLILNAGCTVLKIKEV